MTCEQYAQLYHLQQTAYALGDFCATVGAAGFVALVCL